MHPPLLLMALAVGSTKKQPTTTSFWSDPERVAQLHDPPPPEILQKIQQAPWKGGLEPVPTTGIPWHALQVVRGRIPADLQGVLVRNGPGRIRVGATPYGHWFDGDGLVTRLSLDGSTNSATFVAKYVETERFLAQQQQQQQQQMRTKNTEGMALPGAWTKRGANGEWWKNLFSIPTNPSNTNVLFLPSGTNTTRPRLWAIAEGGHPQELDFDTLDTLGPAAPLGDNAPTSFFSAHFSCDTNNENDDDDDDDDVMLYNHGMVVGPITCLNVMKYQGETLLQEQQIPLDFLTFIHDNVLSEDYLILLVQPFGAPTAMAMTKLLLGQATVGEQLRWNPQELGGGTTLALVISKETLDCVAQIPISDLSSYHMIDAYQDCENNSSSNNSSNNNTTKLTLRLLAHESEERNHLEECFQDLYAAHQVPACHLREYELDLAEGTSRLVERSATVLGELPDVSAHAGSRPARKDHAWVNSRRSDAPWLHSLTKVDLNYGYKSATLDFGDEIWAGAPLFVPKREGKRSDDGYLLTQLYRSRDHGTDIAIVDAASMKELALLRVESHVPYQFHGGWYPS